MLKWIGYGLLAIVLATAIGAGIGFATAPRYTPPAAADEARLRRRAEVFYHGMQLMDFSSMAQRYTPARQMEDHAELAKIAADRARSYMHFKSETRAQMLESIKSINAGELDIRLEGDWAVTRGSRIIHEKGQDIPIPLQALVWLRTDGDWWVYQMKPCELLAYGSPPDFARDLLVDQESAGLMQTDESAATTMTPADSVGEGAGG